MYTAHGHSVPVLLALPVCACVCMCVHVCMCVLVCGGEVHLEVVEVRQEKKQIVQFLPTAFLLQLRIELHCYFLQQVGSFKGERGGEGRGGEGRGDLMRIG